MRLSTSRILGREKGPEKTKENEDSDKDDDNESFAPGQITHYGTESRTILFLGSVDEESGAAFISQLLELDAKSTGEPIMVHFNTPGGELDTMWAMCDVIRMIESPVIGMVVGFCASAGLALLASCDIRTATPNSRFFYHQPLFGAFADSIENVDAFSALYKDALNRYDHLLFSRCKMTRSAWAKEFSNRRDKSFSADEALQWGFVDELMEFTNKTKVSKRILESLREERTPAPPVKRKR